MPSTNQILHNVFPRKADPFPLACVDEKAIYVLGRLRDFEREHILTADPKKLFDSMVITMKEGTRRQRQAGLIGGGR